MEILRTDRLYLRTWTEDDISAGFAIWGDPEVMRFVNHGKPQSLEQVKVSVAAGIKHQEKFGYQHWAVVEIETQKLIGACGFNGTYISKEIEMVFHFSKSSWGKGYATEVASFLAHWCLKELKQPFAMSLIHPNNSSSIHVAEKIGMSFWRNLIIEGRSLCAYRVISGG